MNSTFIWLTGLRCVLQFLKQGWGTVIYFHSTEHFWRSGFGVMFVKYRPYGRWLLIVNMAAHAVAGVLMMFMGRMAWGFGRILGRGSGSFLVTLDLRSVMALGLDFCMTCGVVIRTSR